MSSTLDPVTGLPLFDASAVIEQIPLGQQVFPYADLDASARPTREPYYPDDVIPTSALVVGMDRNGLPRASTMDDSRNLYVNAVQLQSYGEFLDNGTNGPIDIATPNFQTLGNPYVAGSTGPLDVNISANSAGVAGGTPVSGHNVQISGTGEIFAHTFQFSGSGGPHYYNLTHVFQYITAVDVSWAFNTAVTTAGYSTEFDVSLTDNDTLPNWRMNLVRIPYAVLTAGTAPANYIHKQMTFTPPFDIFATLGGVTNFFIETFVDNGFDGYCTIGIWGY